MLYNTFFVNPIINLNNDCRIHKLLELPDYSVRKMIIVYIPLPLKFDNVLIPWKPTVKYLGITLDKKLNWGPQLSTV